MYTVYQTTCLVNGKIYVGVHKCGRQCKPCKYMGSGTAVIKALEKYGKENFIKEILFSYETKREALSKEIEIVTEEFIRLPHVYNTTVGGSMPPNRKGSKMPEEARRKISVSSKKRAFALSSKLKETLKKKKENNNGILWSEEEISKRVETRKKNGNYNSAMKEANSFESISKRVETRKRNGSYNMNNSHLLDKEIIFNRTKTRIEKQYREGKSFSLSTLEKYGIIFS